MLFPPFSTALVIGEIEFEYFSHISTEDDDLASEVKRVMEFVRRWGGKVTLCGAEEYVAKEDLY